MYIPHIPEITSFSEWMDLLANMPECQNRLKAIKEAQDLLNQRIGDYELFTKLKSRQHEIQVALADAKQVKADAEAEAKRIRDKATEEAKFIGSQILGEKAEVAKREKAAAELEARLDAKSKQLESVKSYLAEQETLAEAKFLESQMRSQEAKLQMDLFAAKRAKTLEIWNS